MEEELILGVSSAFPSCIHLACSLYDKVLLLPYSYVLKTEATPIWVDEKAAGTLPRPRVVELTPADTSLSLFHPAF